MYKRCVLCYGRWIIVRPKIEYSGGSRRRIPAIFRKDFELTQSFNLCDILYKADGIGHVMGKRVEFARL